MEGVLGFVCSPKSENLCVGVIHNGLPTKANKKARKMGENSICELCGREEEDEHHAVVRCSLATSLRAEMRKVWCLPRNQDLKYTGPDWLLALISNLDGARISQLLLLMGRS